MEPGINIKITYRDTSRLSMRIGVGGELRVSAPRGTPRQQVLEFIESHRDWIAKAKARMTRATAARDDFFARLPLSTKQQALEVTRRMNETIPPLIDKYASAMGVRPKVVRYRATKSRWGSCRKSTGEVTFSVYLLLLPQWLIEHVVVHELAHLIEPNHGPGFYKLMDRYFPEWRRARAETGRLTK